VRVGDQTISQISPTEDQIVTANADGSQMTTFVDQGSADYEQAQAELDQGYDPYGVRAEPKVVEEPTAEEATNNQPSRMNPNQVGFTQNDISSTGVIRDANGNITGRYTVNENINALREGTLTPDDLGAIRVFVKTPEMNDWSPVVKINPDGTGFLGDPEYLANGGIYTLDNRRLYAFQQAGITDIPVVWPPQEVIERQIWKFDTQNEGTSILVRP
jgi:hypothetical protein